MTEAKSIFDYHLVEGAVTPQKFSDSVIIPATWDVGKTYYVDGTSGGDANDGKSWGQAFLTIAAAVSACAAGDTIAIKGTAFSEAVTCSKAGVRFVGIGTGPAQATWTAPTVAASFCLKIAATGVHVENIKFKPVIYTTSGIPSAIYLDTTATYATIRACRFQGQVGSYDAIYAPAPVDNVKILGNEFLYMNTHGAGKAIQGVGDSFSAWQIKDNFFSSCIVDIKLPARNCLLSGNVHAIVGLDHDGTFGSAVTVQAIDLSGDGSGANVMTRCTLGGTYNLATYKPGATGDVWRGNFASIVATVAPNGLTVLVPAA